MRVLIQRSGILLCALAVFGTAAIASAQSVTRGEVLGRIVDQHGNALPGVTVTLTSKATVTPILTTTGSDGQYRITNIQPGEYTLTSELSGLATSSIGVTVRVGSSTKIDLTMRPSDQFKGEITVLGQAPTIESVTSQVNKYISHTEIQNLPLQNRNFLDVLNTVAGVTRGVPTGTYADRGPRNSFNIHGERSNQNDFLLDGASNNDKSDLNYEDIASVQVLGGPRSGNAGLAGQTFEVGTALQTYNLDAVQEVQLSTSMFSAEFGSGGSGGVINVITRSGTDSIDGSATVQQQRDAWVSGSQKQKIQRTLGALAIGGPIVKGKTHYFASYERDDDKLGFDFSQPTYYVPTYLIGTNLTANYTKRDRFTAKLDQMFSDQNTGTITSNYVNEQANVLQTIFRTRSIDDAVPEFYQNKSFGVIARDLSVLSSNKYLESVVNGTQSNRDFASSNKDPRVLHYDANYNSYATGENSPDTNNTITTLGLSEKLSWASNKFANKAGAGVDYFKQHSAQVEYLSLYDLPTGDPEYLLIPPTNFAASVSDLWAFGQTDWFITPKLTANLGLRAGHDSLIGQTTVEPRVGFAFDPGANGRQVIRAGIGIYHDRSNLIGETGALRPPVEIGNVVNGQDVPSGPPSIVEVDPNLKLPTIYKAVLGYQRQIGKATTAGLTLYANFSRDLFYTDNLNRPDAAGNRPDPTKGTVTFYSNFGHSDVYDVEFETRHRFGNSSVVQASYTYEHTQGNSGFDFISGNDDINRATYEQGQIATYSVSGPLPYDVKHNVKLSGVFNLPLGFEFSTFMNFHTGLPYYFYTSWYELPSYYSHFSFYNGGYNSKRLDHFFNADIRLAKSVAISGHVIQLFLDGFNVTNKDNILSRNGLYAYNYGGPVGNPGTVYYAKFNQPLFHGPKRAAQLGLRFAF